MTVPWYVVTHPSTQSIMTDELKTVDTVLRDCVGLPVKEFALIVQLENGGNKTYTSQSLNPCQTRIFSNQFRQAFSRSVRLATMDATHSGSGMFLVSACIVTNSSEAVHQGGGCIFARSNLDNNSKLSSSKQFLSSPPQEQVVSLSPASLTSALGHELQTYCPGAQQHSSSGGHKRRYDQQQSRSDDADSERKKVRGLQYSLDNNDTPVPAPVINANQLTIGNEAEVKAFYNTRFNDMQQSSCNVIGKAFVSLVEPKKQSYYPYSKGKAPPWWPKTTGEQCVRHKEPDHLLKSGNYPPSLFLKSIILIIFSP